MRRFIEFVVRYKNYITLTSLVVMSFAFMSFGELSRLGGFRAVVVGSIGWVQNIFAWVPNPVALKSENASLRELNLQLSIESARFRQAMVENSKLRRMLELPELTDMPLIATDVIGKTTTELRSFATIGRGLDGGIVEGMACITDAGLVGIIVGASPNYSVIRLLHNRDTRISARTYRSNVDGIIQWEGEEHVALKDVPRTADVKVGDLILTSRFSSRFPPNIIIGRVSSISDEENSLFKKILIAPSVDFSSLSQVFVIDWLPNPERIALEDSLMVNREEARKR